jgi:cytochrome o ubiquinol oxidase subunit 2
MTPSGDILRRFRLIACLPLAVLLCACNAVVLHPAGVVAMAQRDLVLDSTVLMLLVIVPVMVLTVLFAWRYRQSNRSAHYEPDWDHSTRLELVIWSAPLLIIICLGALTWVGTHLLDPFRRLDQIAPGKPAPAEVKSLQVEVVALDWKWLFIYPAQGIATVNELVAPVNMPLELHITSSSVMNSLFIPALAGQIYAMAGMETQLHAVMNQTGEYQGFSANYSGAGFSGMHFAFRSVGQEDFNRWLAQVKAGGGALGRRGYLALARPSQNVPPQHYAQVDPGLYEAIVNLCVESGKTCMNQLMSQLPPR